MEIYVSGLSGDVLHLMLGLLHGGLCFRSGADVSYLMLGLLHGGSGEVEMFCT